MKIKLMSFNTQHCMNYLTQKIDYDVMADAIKRCEADIIGLNEMRGQGNDPVEFQAQVKILADMLGYHFYFAPAIMIDGVNPYGNGLLSRYPILSAEKIMIPDPDLNDRHGTRIYETRCIIKAKIDVPGGLTICATHFGLNPEEARNAVETVLANLDEERCVLMGDLNLKPDNPILAPIQNALFDTAECFDSPKLSRPSDVPNRKIDYIFVTRDVKVTEADIPAIVASDHRPHTAEIEL